MQKRNLVFLVVLTVVLCAVGGNAYYGNWYPTNIGEPITSITLSPSDSAYLNQWYQGLTDSGQVKRAWLHTIGRNSATHPNPDSVAVGDELLTPMGTYCIAQPGTTRHMWRAAELFVATIVQPYFAGTLPVVNPGPEVDSLPAGDSTTVVGQTDDDSPSWYWLVALLAAAGIYLAIRYLNRDRQRTEEALEKENRQRERDRKFVPDPPDFHKATDHSVVHHAQIAATRAFGPHVRIVSTIKRGRFTGTVEMLNADGSTSTERFDNEPGFQARVRFADGKETDIFCRWTCFNPVYNAQGGKCDGKFVEDDSDVAQPITEITAKQMTAIQQSVKGERELTSDDLPTVDACDTTDTTVPETEEHDSAASTPKATVEVSSETPTDQSPVATAPDPEHQIVKIGGCQVSKSRLTLDTFEGTPAQLDKVLDTLTRHSKVMADEKPSQQ